MPGECRAPPALSTNKYRNEAAYIQPTQVLCDGVVIRRRRGGIQTTGDRLAFVTQGALDLVVIARKIKSQHALPRRKYEPPGRSCAAFINFVSALPAICYDFAKCGHFHGFFRARLLLRKSKHLPRMFSGLQNERQSCLLVAPI